MTTNDQTPGWYPDPTQRHELRYHDGEQWTDHISSDGVQITETDVAATPASPAPPAIPAAPTPADAALRSGLSVDKRRQMAFVALGCGFVVIVSAFLPWASGDGGSVNGTGIGIGYLTLLCGIAIGVYGYNALHAPVVRYHPGALTAILLATMVASVVQGGVEDLDSATLGLGDVKPGTGLYLTLLAPLVAIWPLAVFWKDYRTQLAQRRAMAAGYSAP